MKEIIQLNIVMSYPVKWATVSVLRDYVQNFYDAIGPEKFASEFHYDYDRDHQVLRFCSDNSFSPDWLLYMGASSKRDTGKYYAGSFGEGFKIASLIAYRDFGWKIRIESKDWCFNVTSISKKIDTIEKEFLAYEKEDRPYSKGTILCLSNIGSKDVDLMPSILSCFYYPENINLGKCISRDKDYALYHSATGKTGGIYVNYQRRNIFRIPLIFCVHHFASSEEDDRDRNKMSSHECARAMEIVISKLNGVELVETLEQMKKCWSSIRSYKYMPKAKYILEHVLRRLSAFKQECELFRQKYENLIIAPPEYFNKRIRQDSLRWFRNSEYYSKMTVVDANFVNIGIKTLDILYKENGQLNTYTDPDQTEDKYINILQNAAVKLLAGVICYDQLPVYKVIRNDDAFFEGTALTDRFCSSEKNKYGLKVKSHVNRIGIKAMYLNKDSFDDALCIFMHELLHQFGIDSSLQFHKALLLMNQRIMENPEIIREARKKWKRI